MQKAFLLLFSFIMMLSSCNTASVFQESYVKTTQAISLASIGNTKNHLFQKEFNGIAIPSYKNPIKVSALKKSFTKQTHKSYLKASTLQNTIVEILYTDSLKIKPKYIQLKIEDKVALIGALNQIGNKAEKDYLSRTPTSKVITTLSIAFDNQELEQIIQSEAVFLIELASKTYALQLYKKGQKTKIITFNKGVIFGYDISHCCWQENDRNELEIVDLVDRYNNCPKNTYRRAKQSKRNKRKINYYKL